MTDIQSMQLHELIWFIKTKHRKDNASRFAFFLGAGASAESRVPTTSQMVDEFKKALDDRRPGTEKSIPFEDWLRSQDWYHAEGSEYSKLFERFEPKARSRQLYIESLIEGKEPSFGYFALANLMQAGWVNTVMTTNFDDLVNEACLKYTGTRPVVFAYGQLAEEMKLRSSRPRILKLHGDFLYSRLKNTYGETASDDPNMTAHVRQIWRDFGLVVVGYGGRDASVMRALNEFPADNDLFWCCRSASSLTESVKNLLRAKGGIVVEIDSFDSMMDEVHFALDIRFFDWQREIKRRRDELFACLKRCKSPHVEEYEKMAAEQARSMDQLSELYDNNPQYMRAMRLAYAGSYQEAVDILAALTTQYPNSAALLFNLAKAESNAARTESNLAQAAEIFASSYEHYGAALDIEPDDAEILRNWGLALSFQARNTDGRDAEELFRRSLDKYKQAAELASNNAEVYQNWAVTLSTYADMASPVDAKVLREQSLEKHRTSYEIDPRNYDNLCRWGVNLAVYALKSASDTEAEKYLLESIEKHREALRLRADGVEALRNLSKSLDQLARFKKGEDAAQALAEFHVVVERLRQIEDRVDLNKTEERVTCPTQGCGQETTVLLGIARGDSAICTCETCSERFHVHRLSEGKVITRPWLTSEDPRPEHSGQIEVHCPNCPCTFKVHVWAGMPTIERPCLSCTQMLRIDSQGAVEPLGTKAKVLEATRTLSAGGSVRLMCPQCYKELAPLWRDDERMRTWCRECEVVLELRLPPAERSTGGSAQQPSPAVEQTQPDAAAGQPPSASSST